MRREYPVIDVSKTGQNIKQMMQLRGLSVKDVQGFLELSTPQSIYHWFDGRNLPTVDNLYALSELFEVPMDNLICGNREHRRTETISGFDARVMEYCRRFAGAA